MRKLIVRLVQSRSNRERLCNRLHGAHCSADWKYCDRYRDLGYGYHEVSLSYF